MEPWGTPDCTLPTSDSSPSTTNLELIYSEYFNLHFQTVKKCRLWESLFQAFSAASMCILITLLLYQMNMASFSVRVVVPSSLHYICPVFRGGLGNNMFMYASIYGMSRTKNMLLVINENDHINTVFPNLSAIKLKNTTFCEKAFLRGEVRPCAYDVRTLNFERKRNVRLKAYVQSWKYFENVVDDIRKQFVFQRPIQDKAKKVIERYTTLHLQNGGIASNLTIIGVHIRRGDYLLPHNIRYGYNVVSKDYIEKAFTYFRSKFNNCIFLVFTGPSKEDMKWRNENIKGNDTFNVEINHRDIDMCALSMCNHSIVTVGSFGWWSAWLANGITVYFKDVAKENSSLRNDFSEDMEDFFPPKWIGLN